jgi:alkylation response protein AidB-like acyl-CoA dehydrogenase
VADAPNTTPLLSVLTRFVGSSWARRTGLDEVAESLLFRATRDSVRAGKLAARRFAPVIDLARRASLAPRGSDGATDSGPRRFDLTPTDEQLMTREFVQRFAAEHIAPVAAEADENPDAALPAIEAAKDLALSVDVVPEIVGGTASERDVMSGVLLAETLAHADAAIALAVLARRGAAAALTEFGTARQQSRYLAAMVEEEPPTAALAIAEPSPRADPTLPTTRAVLRGDAYVLDGDKTFVPLAEECELFIVTAMLDGEGPTAFVVRADMPGVHVERIRTMGFAAARLGRVRLRDVHVPVEDRLGSDIKYDHGRLVDLGRIGAAAIAVGISQAVLEYVSEYANDRVAFGEPISHRQAVAFEIADMATELEGMRLATWRAAALAERGKACAREAKIALLLATEHGMQIGSMGVQLLGGHGYIREHPVERWYRQLRGIAVMEGATLP